MKNDFGKFIIFMTAIFTLSAVNANADAQPKVVRIASIAYFVDGKSEISGGQSAVIAKQKKLEKELADKGVKLEWYPVPVAVGGPAFNEALANGSTDFASYGDFPAIIAKAAGVDLKLIVPAGRGTNSYLIVPKNSPVKSLADLRGKRIAIHRGRPLELAFSQLVRQNNLKYTDFKLINANSKAGASALSSGSIDALFTGSEAYLLQDKDVGKIIWSTQGTDWKWRAELFVRNEFAQKYPEITQIVANAYVQTAYWSAQDNNRDEVIQITTRSGTPISVVERDYAGDNGLWKDRWSPLYDDFMIEHYREAIRFALEQKLIRREFSVEDIIDQTFLKKSLKELNLESYWVPRNSKLADVKTH